MTLPIVGEQREAIIDAICLGLEAGDSMLRVLEAEGMPSRPTVAKWERESADTFAKIARAREAGYHVRAEKAVDAAKEAKDPALGRLALDAERWYLGKLSKAFAEKPLIDASTTHTTTVHQAINVTGLSDAALAELAALTIDGDGGAIGEVKKITDGSK